MMHILLCCFVYRHLLKRDQSEKLQKLYTMQPVSHANIYSWSNTKSNTKTCLYNKSSYWEAMYFSSCVVWKGISFCWFKILWGIQNKLLFAWIPVGFYISWNFIFNLNILPCKILNPEENECLVPTHVSSI